MKLVHRLLALHTSRFDRPLPVPLCYCVRLEQWNVQAAVVDAVKTPPMVVTLSS